MKCFRICCMLLVAIMMATAFAVSAYADNTVVTYVVQTSDGQPLNLRDLSTGEVLAKLPNGTKLEVYKIEHGQYDRAYVEYEGVSGLYVYSKSIVPLNSAEVTKVDPPKKEAVYSQEGTMLYRVKLDVKKWVNIQTERRTDACTAKHVYRGEYLNVSRISGGWATVILDNGHKRFVEARFLEPVTEFTEPLATPLGEYAVNSSSLNLRAEPSSFAKSRKKLKAGEHVWVVEDLGAWARVANENGKEIGYVMTLFLDPVNVSPISEVSGENTYAFQDEEEISIYQLFPCNCGCENCSNK